MDIRDIARLSGYGTGTVSRVLNGHPNVSDRARERVLAVVAEQGYEPNSSARYLKSQAKTSIAVFVKGARNQLFADLVERIEARLSAYSENAQAVYLGEDEDEVKRAIAFERTRHPKGIIFLGGDPAFFVESFAEIQTPSVLLTNTAENLGFGNLSSFYTDDAAASKSVIDELVSSGHRRIGIIGGNRTVGQISATRVLAAFDELLERGIEFDFDRDFEPCHYTMEEGYDAAKRLHAKAPDITAVFALSDVIALGAMRASIDMGYSIPSDISIIGFDGIEQTNYSVPRLTTVQQDTQRLADLGVDTLLTAIAGRLDTPIHEAVPFNLLRRESVRKI